MRKLTSMKVLTAFMLVLLVAGFAQAQFLPVISGKVTVGDNNDAVANFKMLLSLANNDTIQFRPVFIETDNEGNYSQQVAPGLSYALTAIDTFSYEPFSANIDVGTKPVVYDIHLDYRQQDATVSGVVTAENGSDVGGKTIYLLKLPDDLELSDSLMIETHYEIPSHLTQWASYKTEIASDGSYSVDVLFGKYVVYVEADKQNETLAHWGLLEVMSDVTYDFMLREMKTLAGHITNAEGWDMVKVSGFSLNRGRPFTATADENGDYAMDVAPGLYVVRITATFISDDGDKYLYAAFYDSVYRAEDATLVDVQDDVNGIDFTLPPAMLYPFSVSGTVTSAKTGNPIADAEVTFISFNPLVNLLQPHTVATDEKGNYTYYGKTFLQEDSLIGFAYADGYFGEFYDDAATHVNATPIVYHPDEDITGIDFALDTLDTTNTYDLSGMLFDENGKIVGQGVVTAFTNATNVGVVSTQVDSNGHYDFGAIFPEGSTVYLQAWGGYDYVINIYDNAESWAEATPVVIKGDVTIDFVMKERAPARPFLAAIRGIVSDASLKKINAPSSNLEGAVVYVRRPGDSEWLNSGFVDADGNFDLGVESDGVYEVKITAKGYKDYYNDNVVVQDRSADLDVVLSPTAIDDNPPAGIIGSAKLFNAFPNPFNPSTTIRVNMVKSDVASLVIYNVMGQKVKTLHNGVMTKGVNEFKWNATDDAGRQVASGLYFYQLRTGKNVQTKTVMFIK